MGLEIFLFPLKCILLGYPCSAVDDHLKLDVPRYGVDFSDRPNTALAVEIISDRTDLHFLG